MFDRGVAFLTDGHPRDALEEFQKSLDVARGKQKADSLYNIAVCHVRLGNKDKAVEAATEALAFDPAMAKEISTDDDFEPLREIESFVDILMAAERRARLIGIRGLLLLPAFGLVSSTLLGSVVLFNSFRMSAAVTASGYGDLYEFDLFTGCGQLLLAFYASFRFFGRKRDAPKVMIGMLLANLTLSILSLGMALSYSASPFVMAGVSNFGRSALVAAIWIPYFRNSERVQATFTNDSRTEDRLPAPRPESLSVVGRCALCNAAISVGHAHTWCTNCGKPLTREVLALLAAGSASADGPAATSEARNLS